MHVQLPADRMHPESGAVGRNRKVRRTIHHHEVRRLHSVQQLADVDMQVALRAPHVAVDRDRPTDRPTATSPFQSPHSTPPPASPAADSAKNGHVPAAAPATGSAWSDLRPSEKTPPHPPAASPPPGTARTPSPPCFPHSPARTGNPAHPRAARAQAPKRQQI